MTPTFTNDLETLLTQAGRFADTIRAIAADDFTLQGIGVAEWTVTPQGATVNLKPHNATSHHHACALQHEAHTLGHKLHALLASQGALGVGLRTFTFRYAHNAMLCVPEALVDGQALVRTSNIFDAASRARQVPDQVARYVRQVAALPITIDHQAPRDTYTVHTTTIAAPCARSAVVLYLAARDPLKLEDMLAGTTPTNHRLTVAKVITTTGLDLLDGLLPAPAAP